MTEEKYLRSLEGELQILKEAERNDILRDFREYFASGRTEGKTDESIVESLGTAKELAMELLKAYSEEEFITNVEVKPTIINSFSKVDIESEMADLIILPSEDDKAYVNVKDQDGKTTATMDVIGDTLKIRVMREGIVRKFLFFRIIVNLNLSSNVRVTIQLPQKLYDQLIIRNDCGAIEMTSQQAKLIQPETDNGRIHLKSVLAERLVAETDNGRIIIEDSNFTTASVSTDNGRIVVNKSRAKKFDLSTDNDRIELNDVSGEIIASTDNGRIEGYLPTVTSPLLWKTDNGSITLKTDEPLTDAKLNLKTDMGRIDVYGESGKKFQFGNGTVPIRLKTDMGSITVKVAELEKV